MNRRNDAYRFLSTLYDPLTSPFLDPVRRKLGRILQSEGTCSILDICCGTGRLFECLDQGPHLLIGLDISPSMLHAARKKDLPGTVFIQAEAADPPFRAHSFDAVVLSLALHEKTAEQSRAVLQAASRMLKPSGRLLALDFTRPQARAKSLLAHLLIAAVERSAGKEHYQCFRSFLGLGGLDAFLPKAPGLSIIDRRSFRSGTMELIIAQQGELPIG
jgi:demethylmenaquinone methyltransferase/2-methoxy-6-polyprenyl-1,4-benzoquinol methylase